MIRKHSTTRLAAAIGLLMTGTAGCAEEARFSNFKPLTASAGPTQNEAAPITLGSAAFSQRSIANRRSQLDQKKPNSGSWDMQTVNETGSNKGRFLFNGFETNTAGIQRQDLKTGKVDTIWISPRNGASANHSSFDASLWTPWGTFITAEENWDIQPQPYGRLFELKNPLTAPGIVKPLTAASNKGANLLHQNMIPRTAHEGLQFDKAGHLYFIDESKGGAIYKYTPKADMADVLAGKADYFAAGTTCVLRVGDGTMPNATGHYQWIPFTDAKGNGLPGSVTVTDPNGVASVDARATADTVEFRGTDYQGPEDLQIQTVRGRDYLYVATTRTHEVYRLDLENNTIAVFANRDSVDLATDAAVGEAFASPDNLAIDSEGNIYIVEDRKGGEDDDIWFARDLNRDGDLQDPGEGLGRWASNGTPGSEFTGLYFDPFNKRRAWVHIQHPASDDDRTIEITVGRDRNGGV